MGVYVSLLARPGWLHPTWEIRDCTAGAMTRADESDHSSLGELYGLHGGALKAWEIGRFTRWDEGGWPSNPIGISGLRILWVSLE